MVNIYPLGKTIKCSVEFKNGQTKSLYDPAQVYFAFETPGGVTTTYQHGVNAQLVKTSVGKYSVKVTANELGIWKYKFYSGGTEPDVEEGQFRTKTIF